MEEQIKVTSAVARPTNAAYRYALDIGGMSCGWIYSAEGGYAFSDVITEKIGPDKIIHKHLAGVKYEDITITCGAQMARNFYEWIRAALERKHIRKDGAIHLTDYEGNIIHTMDFFHGLITEISFPALDAASKDACAMTIKIAPETTREKKGSGAIDLKPPAPQKKWLARNFRLQIAGLEEDCKQVVAIDALTIKQQVIEHAVGEKRDYEKEPSDIEIPNLVVTLPESHADQFSKWHHDFLVLGKNDQGQEKSGTLEYLTPDLKETIFKLDFFGLGIFRLTPDKLESGSGNIRRVKAEMYCENIEFKNYTGL